MVKAVVGANWGDEGKGKITDMLAEKADIIVRFQGGANAGHTIVNSYLWFIIVGRKKRKKENGYWLLIFCAGFRKRVR